jgi:hypothetical protein
MNKVLIALALLVFSNVFSSAAFAEDGSSGCGAGWYLFKKNSLVSSSLRATTNGLFFNNTFGMTFGTSNCQKHSIVKKDMEQQYYTEANREYLVVEMAQGGGEYVDTFAKVMGCSDSSVGEFGKVIRENYSKIVPANDTPATDVLQNVKQQIRSNFTLAMTCSA